MPMNISHIYLEQNKTQLRLSCSLDACGPKWHCTFAIQTAAVVKQNKSERNNQSDFNTEEQMETDNTNGKCTHKD